MATPLRSGFKRTAQILRSLGLEQYEAAFRDNAIDDMVLLNLTAEDLKDLGVGSSLAEVRRLADLVRQDCDRLDLLINNAGIGSGGSTGKRQT